jgi:signal recognition particle subunit SRP72
VRKNRMPKVLDPAYKADPERWLPKRERSTFKRRKDKRAKMDRDVGRGTQGASAASAEAAKALDASQRPSASATPSSPSSAARPSPAGAAAAGPRQQRPGGVPVKAKPKKKGGKW